MTGRRYRMPPSNAVLVLLATVAGLIACVAVVVAVAFSTRVVETQEDIQRSRIDNTYLACEEQNGRHDKTIAELDALIAVAKKDPTVSGRRLARIKASRKSTVRLIEALAPHEDCLLLVRERFGPEATPTVLK